MRVPTTSVTDGYCARLDDVYRAMRPLDMRRAVKVKTESATVNEKVLVVR